MVMNNRYSQHARRALSHARLLAQEYQHDAVDTDHLLVGILREKGSLGSQVLTDLTIDIRRAELEVRVLHAVIDPLDAPAQLTGSMLQVLALSGEESNWFSHHYVGTEHLLLALARSRAGSGADLLRTLAISPDQIRRRVRLLLSNGVTEISIEAAKRLARLSELSRRVLNAASQLAAQDHDQPAGLDHLLLVLAREQRSIVSRILRDCGLNEPALEAALGQMPVEHDLTPSALLEDVIDQAVDRADQLGTHYTGTDHMLLALAKNPHGARLLQQHGVNLEHLLAAIYRDLLRPPG
jgi:ATP-dependent Clp protease ATP-binding subunit ClpC